jgi:hypothetical protein
MIGGTTTGEGVGFTPAGSKWQLRLAAIGPTALSLKTSIFGRFWLSLP